MNNLLFEEKRTKTLKTSVKFYNFDQQTEETNMLLIIYF